MSAIAILSLFMMQGCYYDNEEEMYPSVPCDTANVTYSNTIAPIMADRCNTCHSQASPSGQVVTENYNGLKVVATDGRLQGSVNHLSGYSAMPQGGAKLPECNLKKIDIWIRNGSQDN